MLDCEGAVTGKPLTLVCLSFLWTGGSSPGEGGGWSLSLFELPIEVHGIAASRRLQKVPWLQSERAMLQTPL